MVVFTGFDKCLEKSSYSTFADNLIKFQLTVGLTLSLSLSLSLQKRIEDFKNFENFMAEFIFKKVTFHKSCVSLYDKQKLNRKWKLQTNQDQVDQTPEWSTRKTSDSNTDSSKCFFAMLQSKMKSFIFVKHFIWIWGSER